MNCTAADACLIEYVDGQLDEEAAGLVRAHLRTCHACRAQKDRLKELLGSMAGAPLVRPPAALRDDFRRMLAGQEALLQREPGGPALGGPRREGRSGWRALPLRQLAASLLLLLTGAGLGAYLQRSFAPAGNPGEVAALRNDVRRIEQLLTLSALERQPASERIKAVHFADGLAAPNDRVIALLVNTLNGDENVNVRLAAVRALARFAGRPGVTEELLAALAVQTEPLVQIALIHALSESGATGAVGPLRSLAESGTTLDAVRQEAKKGIARLL